MSFRKFALALCSIFFVSATTSIGAFAADRVVTIINETGYTIVEFYGSNAGTNSWEEDILGNNVLSHNASVQVDFDDGTGHCMFDFRAIFEDGDILVQERVDVCKIGTFTYE